MTRLGPAVYLDLSPVGQSLAQLPHRGGGRDVPRPVSKACSLRYSMMKWVSKRHRGSGSLVARKGHRRSLMCRS